MNKTTLIILIVAMVLIVIMVSSAFYWFQLRPAQIRKECAWQALHSGLQLIRQGDFDQRVYDKCLLEHGLEK